MLSFKQSDELVCHQIPSLISFQQQATNEDLIGVEVSAMEGNTNKSRKRLGDESPSSKTTAQRKLVHREIERQRRQDMSKLYASLRDLLPLEFLKGKRSTSDHTHQAVNYIKHMQDNIKALSVKRDRLIRKTSEKSSINNNTISISFCDGGIQILINSCYGFPLSGALKAISEEGFNVISCTCTKVNQRLIHSIQSQVNDPVSIDTPMLQQRLTAIANNY